MKGLPGIDGAELETLLKDLPMPEPGAKDGISVKEAVEVIFTCYITWYITCYITWYGWQLGVLPEMDREAPGLFTASERIIQDFAREKRVYAKFINDLIQNCYTTHSSMVNRIGGI